MRLCDPHFAELMAAFKERGLAHVCSTSHAEALRRYDRDGYPDRPASLDSFDATLSAYNAIIDLSADAVRGDKARFESFYYNAVCPVCSFGKDAFDWTNYGADFAKAHHDRLIGGRA